VVAIFLLEPIPRILGNKIDSGRAWMYIATQVIGGLLGAVMGDALNDKFPFPQPGEGQWQ